MPTECHGNPLRVRMSSNPLLRPHLIADCPALQQRPQREWEACYIPVEAPSVFCWLICLSSSLLLPLPALPGSLSCCANSCTALPAALCPGCRAADTASAAQIGTPDAMERSRKDTPPCNCTLPSACWCLGGLPCADDWLSSCEPVKPAQPEHSCFERSLEILKQERYQVESP